ncbi:type II toxin-antitoxin system VapC family toxin [bacterium]|nr:type II toxin-antitoxin system VapC family toxin [bacterium]
MAEAGGGRSLSLVTDANVWIDLDNGGLTALVFALGYEFVSPDTVVDELGPDLAGRLLDQGLLSHSAGPESGAALLELRSRYKHPSDADLYALLLAIEQGWGLLTGDRQLREAAQGQQLEVHGLLWVLDELVARRLLAVRAAARALTTIREQGARLPADECDERLLRWGTT